MDKVMVELKAEAARLEKRLHAVNGAMALLDNSALPLVTLQPPATKKKRVLSVESRAKLAAAGRKRWANVKKSKA